ncbi:hypothetical protein BJV77DRAFT_465911 [Russula vinacea]|nr:hypothetical protein BJV77DRAFT_465911 [Russula vinacea]
MAMDDYVPMRSGTGGGTLKSFRREGHDSHGDMERRVGHSPIQETLQRVICRTTNRIFVGIPLCQNYDYQTLNLTFAETVVKSAMIIGMFPKPLKPCAVSSILVPFLSNTLQYCFTRNIESSLPDPTTIEFIRPMVEERFAKMEEYGRDWDDKPNDLLMWLMSKAKGVERSVEGLARRLLTINMTAITLTSLSTQVLYRLLAHPEYLEPLREEVDAVIKEEGGRKLG